VFFIVGEFLLVNIAVIFPAWRGQYAACAVLGAACMLLWLVVPESGRWLQVQGRGEEAYEVGVLDRRLRSPAWRKQHRADDVTSCRPSGG
jgi:hypothetical protein